MPVSHCVYLNNCTVQPSLRFYGIKEGYLPSHADQCLNGPGTRSIALIQSLHTVRVSCYSIQMLLYMQKFNDLLFTLVKAGISIR